MKAGENVSEPGIMSLSGIIIATKSFVFKFNSSKLEIYFLKKSNFFLFFRFLADEFKYFLGILSVNSILKKHG